LRASYFDLNGALSSSMAADSSDILPKSGRDGSALVAITTPCLQNPRAAHIIQAACTEEICDKTLKKLIAGQIV
jgi:hypothetical protein